MRIHLERLAFLPAMALAVFLSTCAAPPKGTTSLSGVRPALLPPNVHGRLVARTMQPRYITIHSTENPGGTADQHARYLLNSGKRSKNNPRFGRSGWVTWHFTVDDREAVEHLLPTEQGDHADYGGPGDRLSIGIEICEFRDPRRQAAAIDRAARLTAALANRYHIPTVNVVPHMHWPRWDFPHGKPCPHILLERTASGGWRQGVKWERFIVLVQRYR
jgi:N-acetylmuramoyl-L-alanine amidase